MAKVEKRSPIVIGGITVKPGERKTIDLPVAKLYTHTEMTMSVHVVHGRKPGPTLFVTSSIHGDELNGVEIVRRLLKRKNLSSLHGTLIAIPIVNSFGFINRDRYLPDRRDLNRSFPGSDRGSLASRIADLLLAEILAKCTHGIDLHTGSNHRFNLPQIRAFLEDNETAKLAETFGAPVMINSQLRDGSLRGAIAELNIPILLYEAGEALRFDELSIRLGYRGILSVMREIGMFPYQKQKKREVFKASTSRWVRAPISGIVARPLSVGKMVQKGDLLAIVSDPFGENEEEMLSPITGLIIGRSQMPLVYEGDALFHVAIMEGEVPEDQMIERIVSELENKDFWPQPM